MDAQFVFATCQAGAEAALKAEVARLRPGWRFAFSRPGLVTFRADAPVGPDLELPAVFARAFGASLGKADEAQIVAAAQRLAMGAAPLHLHAFPRDGAGEEGEAAVLAEALRGRLLAAAGAALVQPPRPPRPGELVLDVVVAPGEALLLGVHAHGPGHSIYPGGDPRIALPPEAPSRAYLKLEEGLAWSGLPLRPGQCAVEIGSAPGGASHALLRRGLRVVGVDPGAMDPRVLADPAFTHLQLPLGDLRREQLPAQVDWLLLDVNLAPQVALHGVRRIVSLLRPSLRGVLFTLKLNDWAMAAEVPALLQRVAGMGLGEVRATQLPANRREICVAALAPQGGRRGSVGRPRPSC